MTDAKVVSLNGDPIPQPGKPNESLVRFLEDMLARAKGGDVVGFVGATMDAERVATFYLAGTTGGFSMLGALDCARHKLIRVAIGEKD